MPKWLKASIIAVLSAAALGGVVYGVLCLVRAQKGNDVNVYPVKDLCTDYTWANQSETGGCVKTDKVQSVYTSSTQQITEIYVKEGQTVKAGDQILAFDTTLSDIEVKRQEIAVNQLTLDLANAKKEREAMNSYKTSSGNGSTEDDPSGSLTPMAVPYLVGGEGTADKPYIYLWDDTCTYNQTFIDSILPKSEDPAAATETPVQTEASPSAEESTPEGQPTPTPTPEQTAEPGSSTVYVVFQVRKSNALEGTVLRTWEMTLWRTENSAWAFSIREPDTDSESSETETDPENGSPSGDTTTYTSSELKKMKAEADKKILDLTLQLKQAQLKYKELEYELNNGVVTSKVDGVVKTVLDPEEALADNKPVVLISGGGGYYVQAQLSELELASMKVGDTVNVQSWETNSTLEGKIVEISEFPVTDSNNSYYYSQGNQNVSLYPFTIFLDEDANLREGEYVDVTYYPDGQDTNGLYLPNAFIRTENGKSYVYVVGEDGLLEKRDVLTGKNLWGSNMEITSGLSEDDFIAFPYGRDVKDGAKVVNASINDLYSSTGYYG